MVSRPGAIMDNMETRIFRVVTIIHSGLNFQTDLVLLHRKILHINGVYSQCVRRSYKSWTSVHWAREAIVPLLSQRVQRILQGRIYCWLPTTLHVAFMVCRGRTHEKWKCLFVIPANAEIKVQWCVRVIKSFHHVAIVWSYFMKTKASPRLQRLLSTHHINCILQTANISGLSLNAVNAILKGGYPSLTVYASNEM